MIITGEQITEYNRNGFLVLETFVHRDSCDRLRARAERLVRDFDPTDAISIFSTREQSRLTDDYFLDSGDKIRCFFEENAFFRTAACAKAKRVQLTRSGMRCTTSIRYSTAFHALPN